MQGLQSVTIIIRTVGERTEDACRDAIFSQGIASAQIVTVREAPFSRALRIGLEAGIDAGRPWTLCVDADVILRPGAVSSLLAHAERQRSDVFKVQGFVLDKFSISIRSGGGHLYRTKLLPKMAALISQEGNDIRPETEAMRRMRQEGYPWAIAPYVVGIHDFCQYNHDIFRKCFTHAHKHLHFLPALIPKIRARATNDADFVIALEGFAAGLRETGKVYIDVRHRPFAERFDALGLPEKLPLIPGSMTSEEVDRILCSWAADDDVTLLGLPVSAPEAIAMNGATRFNAADRWRALIRRKRQSSGPGRLALSIIGHGLEQTGRWLRARGERLQ